MEYTNIAELEAQQAALAEQIAAAKAEAAKEDTDTIHMLMRKHGITKIDLGTTKKVAPKWQNPNGPETWTGRGMAPKWFDKTTAISLTA